MDGTIFGIEIKAFVFGLEISWCILIILTAIFITLWRREVNERRRQSKKLLEEIKFSFSNEITIVISEITKAMENVITDFSRGKYFVIFENAISKLSKEFSQSTSLLCYSLNKLRREIEDGVDVRNISIESRVKVASLISLVSTSIKNMRLLIDNCKIKDSYDVRDRFFEKGRLIEDLRNNVNKLQKHVSELNKSRE